MYYYGQPIYPPHPPYNFGYGHSGFGYALLIVTLLLLLIFGGYYWYSHYW
ncbi:hypothetical protein [Alkalibacillus silvisoli]|uniref:YjcZ family sporulation protein n=1 Tax=Alkalibacillus silvisoli TaxID=392823 RepID=A0ABN0ZS47_9BACI